MQNKQNLSDIAQLGAPVLRMKALKVEDIGSERTFGITQLMRNVLAGTNGVGLAAPQVYQSERIVIIASHPSERYPLAPRMDPLVMFNPHYEVLSSKLVKDWEGCLSIPGIRALVSRNERIKILYFNSQEQHQEMIVDGFIARIFQHEYDHLDGLVYLDRVNDNKDIISETEFIKMKS